MAEMAAVSILTVVSAELAASATAVAITTVALTVAATCELSYISTRRPNDGHQRFPARRHGLHSQ